jgi:hypothetical protein
VAEVDSTMTYPVRAITAPELALLRSDGQHCQILMSVLSPATVMSACAVFSGSVIDRTVQVQYTPVSGSWTSVQPGMELLVGSTPGGRDLGRARIRKAADTGYLYIGETSDIVWTNGCYLSVTNNYGLWPRQPNVLSDGETWFMDWDVVYSAQYSNADPVPIMGPGAAVLYLNSGSASVQMNGSDSWCYGNSIASYSWTVSSGSVTNPTSASPIFTFTSAGSYLVNCTVTSGSGTTNTGHRYVFVYDSGSAPISNFVMNSCVGEAETGSWTANITLYDTASFNLIQDGAFLVLHTKDFYGSSASSIGQIPGYENILFEGWVDGQSIDYNGEIGSLKFTCRNAGGWLDKITLRPLSLKDQNTGSDTWIYLKGLTSDLAAWAIAHWRSTIDTVCDFRVSGDTRFVAGEDAQIGTIWWQLQQIGYHIFANPEADRFNRVFFEIDCQMLPFASRSNIPTIQTITKNDWFDVQSITRVTQTPVSILDVSGTYWNMEASAGSVQPVDFYGVPLYSRHPGTSPHQFGKPQTKDRLAFNSQADCNQMCGLLGGKLNNEYPNVNINLAENNRMFDITPCMYAVINMDASDNPRGISWSNKRFIPDRITYKHDPAKGGLTVEMEFAAETFQLPSTTIIKPVVVYPGLGDFGIGNVGNFPITFQPSTWFPSVVPSVPTNTVTPSTCLSQDLQNGPFTLMFDQPTLTVGQSTYSYCHCWIRKNTSSNRTVIQLYMTGLTGIENVSVSAIDTNKNVIMNGIIGDSPAGEIYLPVSFNNTSDTEVWGFKITYTSNTVVSGSSAGNWFYTWYNMTSDPWLRGNYGNPGHPNWNNFYWNMATKKLSLPYVFGGAILNYTGNVGLGGYVARYASVSYNSMYTSDQHQQLATMDASGIKYFLLNAGYPASGTPDTTASFNTLAAAMGFTYQGCGYCPSDPYNSNHSINPQNGVSDGAAVIPVGSPWMDMDNQAGGSDPTTFSVYTSPKYVVYWSYGSPIPTSSYISINGGQPIFNICGVS